MTLRVGILAVLLSIVCSGAVRAGEASTAQLLSFVVESLATDEEVILPDELRRRTGEIIGLATDLDPTARAYAVITLALMDRGDLITPAGYAPPEKGQPLERIAAAFARCQGGKDCAAAVAYLRLKGGELNKKGSRLRFPEAVELVSLLPQDGFAAWADALATKDPGQRDMIEVARQRHAAKFSSH